MRVPTYNLSVILDLRRRIADAVEGAYYAMEPEGLDFEGVVDLLVSFLHGVNREVVRESVRHLAGQEFTAQRIEDLSWQLAGNVWRLRHGVVTPPWTKQSEPEWCPAQLMRVLPCVRHRKLKDDPLAYINAGKKCADTVARRGAEVTVKLLAGTAAGRELARFWSVAYIHTIKQELGFCRYDRERQGKQPREGEYPLRDLRELTRLRLRVLLDPAISLDGPVFTDVSGSAALKEWNRAIMARRRRVSFECPMRYSLVEVPCYRCEVGYDRCQAGCHPTTYVLRPCKGCGQDQAWADPSSQGDLCVDCSTGDR